MSLSSMRMLARRPRGAIFVRSVATTPRTPMEDIRMSMAREPTTEAEAADIEYSLRPTLEKDVTSMSPEATPGNDPQVNWSLMVQGITPAGECWRNMSWETYAARSRGEIKDGAAVVAKSYKPMKLFRVGDAPHGDFNPLPSFAYDDFALATTNTLCYANDGLYVVDGTLGSSRAADRRVRYITDDPDSARAVQHLLHPLEKAFPVDGPFQVTLVATEREVEGSPAAPGVPVGILSPEGDEVYGVLASSTDPSVVQRMMVEALAGMRGAEMEAPQCSEPRVQDDPVIANDPLNKETLEKGMNPFRTHMERLHRGRDADALAMRCDAYVAEDGASTLVFGAPALEVSGSLYAAGATSWAASGLAAVFGGILGKGVAPEAGDVVFNDAVFRNRRVVNAVAAPKRAVFVNPKAKAAKTVAPADIKALFQELYAIAPAGSDASASEADNLIERLQAAGTEVVEAPASEALKA